MLKKTNQPYFNPKQILFHINYKEIHSHSEKLNILGDYSIQLF